MMTDELAKLNHLMCLKDCTVEIVRDVSSGTVHVVLRNRGNGMFMSRGSGGSVKDALRSLLRMHGMDDAGADDKDCVMLERMGWDLCDGSPYVASKSISTAAGFSGEVRIRRTQNLTWVAECGTLSTCAYVDLCELLEEVDRLTRMGGGWASEQEANLAPSGL